MKPLKCRASVGQTIDSDGLPDLRPIASFISTIPWQTGHVGDVESFMMKSSERL
jgi:hypothetical protein